MGIRFSCPNGHSLHVKSFLAGKLGICPHCGAKFQIPEESEGSDEGADSMTPPATEPDQASKATVAAPAQQREEVRPEQTVGSTDTQPGVRSESKSLETPNRPPVKERGPAAVVTPKSNRPEPVVNAQPTPTDTAPTSAAPASSVSDPISEAPHADWYVRPPTGGQFGPASGDIMRTWISEGRVTPDSLVWREGWADWQKASATFQGLKASSVPTPVIDAPTIVTAGREPTALDAYRRRKSTKTTLAVVVFLLVACLILFGVLVYVIRYVA